MLLGGVGGRWRRAPRHPARSAAAAGKSHGRDHENHSRLGSSREGTVGRAPFSVPPAAGATGVRC